MLSLVTKQQYTRSTHLFLLPDSLYKLHALLCAVLKEIGRFTWKWTVDRSTVRTVARTCAMTSWRHWNYQMLVLDETDTTQLSSPLTLLFRPINFQELHAKNCIYLVCSQRLLFGNRCCCKLMTSLTNAHIAERRTTSFDFARIVFCRLDAIFLLFYLILIHSRNTACCTHILEWTQT